MKNIQCGELRDAKLWNATFKNWWSIIIPLPEIAMIRNNEGINFIKRYAGVILFSESFRLKLLLVFYPGKTKTTAVSEQLLFYPKPVVFLQFQIYVQ